jgi:hypothetical protein
MTDSDYADTHARLTEIAVLSLSVENLVAYIDRVRSAPVADSTDHVDLALAIAGVQQIAHRLLADACGA